MELFPAPVAPCVIAHKVMHTNSYRWQETVVRPCIRMGKEKVAKHSTQLCCFVTQALLFLQCCPAMANWVFVSTARCTGHDFLQCCYCQVQARHGLGPPRLPHSRTKDPNCVEPTSYINDRPWLVLPTTKAMVWPPGTLKVTFCSTTDPGSYS